MSERPDERLHERPSADVHIQVAHGRVTGHQGVRFGGVACVTSADGKPARVRVAVYHQEGELVVDLREGESLRVHGQTWMLRQIDNNNSHGWHASLVTR